MYRRLFSIFVMLVFISQHYQIIYAAPAYGTSMPEKKRWTWGLEGGFIIDRNLDNNQGGTHVNRFFLTGSYGIFPWLCFDGKLGVGNVEWKRTQGNADLTYNTNFAGGYGFRIRGIERKKWGIKSVIGFQHISVHPEVESQIGTKHEVIIDEWQGSIVVSKEFKGFIIPYLGGRYGTLDFIKWENEHDRKRIHSERHFGMIIGLDYCLDKKTRINLEGILLDSEEFTIGIRHDF